MKKIMKYLKQSAKKVSIVLLITFLLLGIQIIIPLFTRSILNNIEINKSFSTLIIGLAVYGILLTFYNFIDVCWYISLDYLGGEILENMRTDLMRAIFFAPYKKLTENGFEKIKNILYMDTLSIYSSLTVQIVNMISNLLVMIVFNILSFYVDTRLGVFLIIVEVVSLLISIVTRKKISSASGKVNQVMKKNNQILNEYVDSLETVRNNYLLNYFINKELDANKEFIKEAIKSDRFLVALKNVTQHFHKWASLFISALLILVIDGNSGDLVFALLVLDIVLAASERIENCYCQLMKSKPSFEYVNMLNDMLPSKNYERIKDVNEIQWKNVFFGYEKESIINNMSVIFKKGDIVHIKGKNGSGKTTFLKLMTVLLQPDRGQILFDGKNVSELNPEDLSKLIVYVSQDETLLNENFTDYLKIVTNEPVSEEEIEKVITELSINRENQTIENLGMSLSGGQRKKLLFAKLKLREKNTPVLIIDELENAMDQRMRENLEKYKKYLYQNRQKHIIFVISHEENANNFYTREIIL